MSRWRWWAACCPRVTRPSGAIVLAMALGSIVSDEVTGISLGRRLTPEHASQNVVARTFTATAQTAGPTPQPAGATAEAGGVKTPLIITANYDAGRTALDIPRPPTPLSRRTQEPRGPGRPGLARVALDCDRLAAGGRNRPHLGPPVVNRSRADPAPTDARPRRRPRAPARGRRRSLRSGRRRQRQRHRRGDRGHRRTGTRPARQPSPRARPGRRRQRRRDRHPSLPANSPARARARQRDRPRHRPVGKRAPPLLAERRPAGSPRLRPPASGTRLRATQRRATPRPRRHARPAGPRPRPGRDGNRLPRPARPRATIASAQRRSHNDRRGNAGAHGEPRPGAHRRDRRVARAGRGVGYTGVTGLCFSGHSRCLPAASANRRISSERRSSG